MKSTGGSVTLTPTTDPRQRFHTLSRTFSPLTNVRRASTARNAPSEMRVPCPLSLRRIELQNHSVAKNIHRAHILRSFDKSKPTIFTFFTQVFLNYATYNPWPFFFFFFFSFPKHTSSSGGLWPTKVGKGCLRIFSSSCLTASSSWYTTITSSDSRRGNHAAFIRISADGALVYVLGGGDGKICQT